MGNRAGEYSAVLIMFTVLSFISVCLRCFVRFRFTKLAYDDLFAVCALVGCNLACETQESSNCNQLTFMGQCVCDLYGIYHGGVTYHFKDVSVATYQIGLQV
jgi:hypothetical protein